MAAIAAIGSVPSRASAADDPYVRYWTIETPRFRIHYPKHLEPVAERVADLGEDVHRRLTPVLGHVPTEVTELVLTDGTESANGSATALPYNTVRLFATAPDDMSPLSDYDDWYLELVTHEYTHILHTDNISGLPAVLNAVLGKTFAPNQVQPRWILEGLAVLQESEHTSAGRNRSSVFDMYLRADVLAGKVAGLDRVSNNPRTWPGGNYWYLYGSRFLTWINQVYGDHAMRTVAADYGHLLVPFGLNRSIRRAIGNTYDKVDDGPALYDGWRAHIARLYKKQIDDAREQGGGLREGKRITHHGRVTQRPRWIPPPARRQAEVPEVLYYADDGHHRTGFYRLPVPSASESWESQRDLFLRAQGDGSATFDARGNVVFSSTDVHKRVYSYSDLSRVRVGHDSPDGDEAARERLSVGQRALDPDVTQDGRQLVFGLNRRGTQYVAMADLTAEGTLGEPRVVVPSARFEQAYTPRFSPDGRKIAYSAWTRGGYRDIRIVDVATGTFRELFHDRAIDQQPSWSADGKTLFFTSDRTGIPNVFARDLETGETFQVTNVTTGAFMPEPSPDGRTLVYVGYTTAGFDLFAMPLDRASWTPARPYVDDRPDRPSQPVHRDWPRHPYDPLPSFRPRAVTLDYGPGTFGQTLVVGTRGSDAVGHHAFAANVLVDSQQAEPSFSLAYVYGRLPVDLGIQAFRTVNPRTGYVINGKEPEFIEQFLGIGSSLTYTVPRAFDVMQFTAGYTASRYSGKLPLGPVLDPQETILQDPVGTGFLGVVRASFAYSNTERYLYSVGPARGATLQLGAELASRETGSDYDYYSFSYTATGYTQMPWHPDHTLVTLGRSAIAGGNYPRRGVYYTGGLVDLPLADAVQNGIYQGAFVLRGYPPNAYSGRQYHLATAEYRFPLWHPERGLSTLPLFFSRMSGALFVDYGGAFDDLDVEHWRSQLHTGYGAELLVDGTFGYFVGITGRLGYARGLSEEAYSGGKFYLVLSSPY